MIRLADPQATDALGLQLARALRGLDHGLVVSLNGELGAGKTALTRATLRGLGHTGRVVSPSYTLVEPYSLGTHTLFHLDLYRLGDPEELEFLGIREVDTARDWVFVEWAERGAGFLPAVDIDIRLEYEGNARRAHFEALTETGARLIPQLGIER
ncbi:tRNA (adenosine(37)-N6)-threonylcarbamoyltransferase complex ATPase subunit type 1 TsaE [Salinisphaera sp.]|uniref:tRNA (adenosine(37)-N6)-threonylcarbamoyltransferase complex ATPase subunit type 1 TsaE n=1 Tax=Salinisphaera sp. TaxID=1914330 RepID=UPI000C5F0312|nr:tRNA (adenosine(37)-N6)-threonylcarbamoyltransferase complex ATPase subunit type 1 TsaE [Salinisphaera sp.]MBS63865.1 tRNA (adenosine(37)-N6)-threonylcarbamoyltransferase complex ATPase subunit type 1 TsaE [Salinisphaera sp.]